MASCFVLASDTSRLAITDIRVGGGAEAVNGKKLTIYYTTSTENGKQLLDTQKQRKPMTFILGDGVLIAGVEQGLVGMKSGGIRRLIVPPHLAYGQRPISHMIPPNSTLIFEIELLTVE